jgi:pimeloyl-ACP methyl ester carboxylesterase
MDYKSTTKQRSKEMRPGLNGRFEAEWTLTDSRLLDTVKLTFPPGRAIPVVFVPGIMGSNLSDLKNNPVWLLDSLGGIPAGLAWDWSGRRAGERQKLLHPSRTRVYEEGAVPKRACSLMTSRQDYLRKGWGEVSEASYHQFLFWLDSKMNGERNPASWEDFTHASVGVPGSNSDHLSRKLAPGLVMNMNGLPKIAENGFPVEAIKSDELLRRAKAVFPIYAFGYNWLASNNLAAESLKIRIEKIIAENNSGVMKCTQVILVTHSMGGLVARACTLLPGMSDKIAGVVHGVMPATGAAVAYRRCKVGMRDESFSAGLVIGSNGKEVTAVFAQSPGALQLLPSEEYGTKWLEVQDVSGNTDLALPLADPYEEIYLERNKWWGLIREEWLSPTDGLAIIWNDFKANIKHAKEFHRSVAGKYHPKTYVFYGGGPEKKSYSKIRWNLKRGTLFSTDGHSKVPSIAGLRNSEIRTDSSNNLYFGGQAETKKRIVGGALVATTATTETSQVEIRCAQQDSSGDGTVPVRSGRAPAERGGMAIRQQFQLPGIEHEPAYSKYPQARQVAYYAITKIAANADLS